MANPSKAKGTGGETELLRLLDMPGLVRTPPGTEWDLEKPGIYGDEPLTILATRPDRGQWLLTMDLVTFERVLHVPAPAQRYGLRVEVKRYKRFSLHSIFEGKFGKGA